MLIEEFGYLEQRGIAPEPETFAKRYARLSWAARQELFDALEIKDESHSKCSDSNDINPGANETHADHSHELIGRYEVIRVLGKGTFGKVYLAKDPDLDRSVAIKIPTNKRIKMGGGPKEFLNEARAVAKLDHPNIVPVYDCGISEDGRCFVVSKYVRGKELRAEIRKGIDHREAAHTVCQLARALHVAHVAGIVHRDVKPGNVIIDSKRQPHLLDFGLAIQDSSSAESDAFIGTPAYMSPEQAEGGSHRVDGRSDIYSLAVVFYEMLTGHRPCKSDIAKDILTQLKHGEVRPPRQSDDTIPIELEEICLRALSRQLSDRYSTAKDMAEELEEWLIESSADTQTANSQGSTVRTSIDSSSSHRTVFDSKKTSHKPVSPFVRFITFPATIVVGILMLVVVAIMLTTNPPWKLSADGKPQSGAAGKPQLENDSKAKAPASASPKRIAVLGFRNLSDLPENAWLGTGLAELITEELEKSEQLAVVSSENVSLMKADLDLTHSEVLGASALKRIKKRLDADWVVLGSYAPDSLNTAKINFSITLQETSHAEEDFQFDKTVDTHNWLELVTSASAQLRRQLEIRPPSIVETGQLNPSAPGLAAAKDYFDGIAHLRSFNSLAAKKSFEQAASHDTQSALIQDALAQANQQLGDENSARKSSANALKHLSSLPLNQQLKIRARHHLLVGETAKAVADYQALFELRNEGLEERLSLAAALTRAGQGWKAFKLLDEARQLPQTDAARARIELVSSEAAQSISEFSQQLEMSRVASAAAAKVGARLFEGLAKLSEGNALRRIGEHGQAVICFDKAVKLLVAHGDRQSATIAMAAWGKTLVDHGQLDEAEEKINEGLLLANQLGNQRLNARLTGQLGEVRIYRGKFPEAEKLLSESLRNFTELGDRQGIADMNLTLANVMARTGKPAKAMEMVGAARKAFQASGDRRGEGRTWGQQGAMFGRQGRMGEAQQHFERALELFREVGDRRGVATCLGDLASTNSNQGKLTKAGELYSEALELLRQLNSKRGPEMVMYNLSNLYARTGRLDEAEKLMTDSLKRYKAQKKWMNACFVERKLADIQLRRGSLAQAKNTVADALTKSREVGSLAVEAQALSTLADIALYEGKFAEAQKQIEASQGLSRKLKQELGIAACDLFSARLSLRKGLLEDAKAYFQKAEPIIKSGKPEYRPFVLFFQSRLEAAGENQLDAVSTFAKGESALEENKTEDEGIKLLCRLERARALAAIGRVEDAATEFRSVAKLAQVQGWIALELESNLLRYELPSTAGSHWTVSELDKLKSKATEGGFNNFAERAANLK